MWVSWKNAKTVLSIPLRAIPAIAAGSDLTPTLAFSGAVLYEISLSALTQASDSLPFPGCFQSDTVAAVPIPGLFASGTFLIRQKL